MFSCWVEWEGLRVLTEGNGKDAEGLIRSCLGFFLCEVWNRDSLRGAAGVDVDRCVWSLETTAGGNGIELRLAEQPDRCPWDILW